MKKIILPAQWKIKYLPIQISEEGWKTLISQNGHEEAKKIYCSNCRVKYIFAVVSAIIALIVNVMTISNPILNLICIITIIIILIYICAKEINDWDFNKLFT